MPRISGDLLGALRAAAAGNLVDSDVTLDDRAAVTVVLASPDYPQRGDYPGVPITGLDEAAAAGALVFHGGTAARDGRVITHGGRILSVTATADSIPAARARAYAAVDLVSFEGARFRHDIAAAAGG
jgi:phosphoribosylamine---glycine ligase